MLQLNFKPFPDLFTERLHLRAMKEDDLDDLFKIRSNAEINKYINRKDANSKEDILQFMDRINRGMEDQQLIFWIINIKESQKVIGSVVLWNIDTEKDRAELGYELLPAYHGKGFMSETIESVIDYGFSTMNVLAIDAITHFENNKSLALLDRFKFKSQVTQIDDKDVTFYYLNNPSPKEISNRIPIITPE